MLPIQRATCTLPAPSCTGTEAKAKPERVDKASPSSGTRSMG